MIALLLAWLGESRLIAARSSTSGRALVVLGPIVLALIAGVASHDALRSLGGLTAAYVGGALPAALVAAVWGLALGRRGRGASTSDTFGLAGVWRRFRKHRLAVTSMALLAILIEASLWAGVIEVALGVSHQGTSLEHRYGPYVWPHLLGTDDLGRDVLTRLLFGGQISLAVGVIAALSSALLGSTVGLVAGWFGGRIDAVLMRFTDAMLGVPVLPLMIVLSAIELDVVFAGGASWGGALLVWAAVLVVVLAGPMLLPRRPGALARAASPRSRSRSLAALGLVTGLVLIYLVLWEALSAADVLEGNFASVVKIILIITFFGWMSVARLARAAALQIRELEYVSAARALGASDLRIVLRHVLPNALAPMVVAATLEVGGNILYEAALSFLGLGIQPPVPSWGNMLNNALDFIKREPLLAFWPGMLTLTCVTCFNFVGDGLRDALDPHMVVKPDR